MALTFQKNGGNKINIEELKHNDASSMVSLSLNDITCLRDELKYRLLEDGTYSVAGHKLGSKMSGAIVIPSTYHGVRITSIDERAFEYYRNISTLIIGDNVTTIEKDAFYGYSKFDSVVVPTSLASVGDGAFRGYSTYFKVYYKGQASDWDKIAFGSDNSGITEQRRYYYSETKPTTEGNYWHYVDGEIFEWGSTCENGHTWERTSCTTPLTCSVCGATKGEGFEHTWSDWEITKRQNCTEAGEKTRTCSVCGEQEIATCGTALGHDYEGGLNVVLPTCTEKGYEEQLCLRCREYIKNEIEPLGHDWGDWYQDEATGNYYCDCLRCGHQKIQQAESYVYTPLDDGTYSVSAGDGVSGDIFILSEHNGKPVVSIADYAFLFRPLITSVIIDNGITSIGKSAFDHCANIERVEIPDSVKFIGEYAFSGCSSLARMELPEGIESIPKWMFALCRKLEEVNIPVSVTSIGDSAFAECSSIAEIILPDGVTSIGEYAFDSCYSLASLFIPASVQRIHYGAFRGCANLSIEVDENSKYYRMRNGCLWEIKTSTVIHGEVEEIPDDTIAIGDGAFYGNTYFAPIKIPLSVTKIGSLAFGGQPVTVHVEAKSKHEGWVDDWCDDSVTVVWGYTEGGESCSHEYGGWTTTALPTCTICGSMRRTCSICGNVDIALIDPLGHKYETVVTPPTCGEQGYTTYTCTRCGHSYKDNYVDATGEHHYEITTIPPTCEDEGYQVYACKGCNHSYTANFKEALGHNSSDWIIEVYPDFEMEGRKYKKCLRCGEILETATIPRIETLWDFTLLEDGTYSVKPKEDVILPSKIDIPSEYEGIAVTRIENSAFEGYWSNMLGDITSVNIPSSITHIGGYAFQDCRSLTEITIPITVTYVGRQAFYEAGEDGITIYCEAQSQPSGWDSEWADSTGSGNTVIWNSRCRNGHNLVDGICTRCGHIDKMLVYYGVSTIPERYNSAFVLGLDQKVPSNSHLNSISVTPLEDEYIYYCSPTSFGDCNFAYNNFVGGFSLIIEGLALTNAGGKTEAYNIYKSNQANLGANGAITITIKEMG